ncbi:MAG: glycosyltransferase family 9 protein [Bacteroidota bacterium]
MEKTLRNILVVRTDRLGDVVLTLPMLPILKKHYPQARLTMLLRSYTAEIVEGNPYVDHILFYDRGGHERSFVELLSAVKSEAFDGCFVVHPRFRVAFLLALAGIPIRVGTGYRWYSFLFNRRIYEHRKMGEKHEVEYNLGLLKAVDIEPSTERVEFAVAIPPEAVQKVGKLQEELGIRNSNTVVIIHPGSGRSARDWRPVHFRELASQLSSKSGTKVIITGGKDEGPLVHEVSGPETTNCIPLSDQLSLKELAALMRLSDLFISNSTGPIHIAAAVGTPVIGFYPNVTVAGPQRWGPYTTKKRLFVGQGPLNCVKCLKNDTEPCECMDRIRVEDVLNAVEELLQMAK